MAGYVLDTRELPGCPPGASFSKSASGHSSYLSDYSMPVHRQTTYSFRSRGRDDSSEPAGASSQVDFIRRLREEHQGDRGGTDRGHSFWTTKNTSYFSHPYVDTNPADIIGKGRYVGPLVLAHTGAMLPVQYPTSLASDSEAMQKGAEFIARTAPTNPAVNISESLGEILHKGLPSITSVLAAPTSLKDLAGKPSDAYLSYQFGLKPLGEDLGKAAAAVLEARKILEQYQRDSGRVVRRRRTDKLPATSTTEYTNVSLMSNGPYFHEAFLDYGDAGSITTRVDRTWSFSGAYSYLVPSIGSMMWEFESKFAKVNKVLGTEFNLETFWNLSPWSWLADWVSNTGDVISNMEAFQRDNLVLRYGYVMCHTRAVRTYTRNSVTFRGSERQSGPISIALTSESKQRWQATPYGFGVNWTDFTPFQNSILAALGIKRASR